MRTQATRTEDATNTSLKRHHLICVAFYRPPPSSQIGCRYTQPPNNRGVTKRICNRDYSIPARRADSNTAAVASWPIYPVRVFQRFPLSLIAALPTTQVAMASTKQNQPNTSDIRPVYCPPPPPPARAYRHPHNRFQGLGRRGPSSGLPSVAASGSNSVACSASNSPRTTGTSRGRVSGGREGASGGGDGGYAASGGGSSGGGDRGCAGSGGGSSGVSFVVRNKRHAARARRRLTDEQVLLLLILLKLICAVLCSSTNSGTCNGSSSTHPFLCFQPFSGVLRQELFLCAFENCPRHMTVIIRVIPRSRNKTIRNENVPGLPPPPSPLSPATPPPWPFSPRRTYLGRR